MLSAKLLEVKAGGGREQPTGAAGPRLMIQKRKSFTGVNFC